MFTLSSLSVLGCRSVVVCHVHIIGKSFLIVGEIDNATILLCFRANGMFAASPTTGQSPTADKLTSNDNDLKFDVSYVHEIC